MGKTEKGTPKDIANRMKAKGLQKLKWYCQMCQKQCRDENGFKCHTTSESHQRQLLLFADNPDKYLDSFSEEFYEGYISLLKRRFGTKRIHANNVYQEYIHDRHHVHMNATQWETLTDFVKWLGREGHCIVDETEKGWFVTYIDRDPETILRQEQVARKEKFERDEEERFQEFIKRQVKFGKQKGGHSEDVFSELKRDESEVITLDMKVSNKKKLSKITCDNPLKASIAKNDKRKGENIECNKSTEPKRTKKRLSGNFAEGEKPWLFKNIFVKVITKEHGGKYFKKKGIVIDVIDSYGAEIKLLDCGTKLKLDQVHLETVIPAIDREVLILEGEFQGEKAILKSLDVKTFSSSLEIISSPKKGCTTKLPYEHFSKFNS